MVIPVYKSATFAREKRIMRGYRDISYWFITTNIYQQILRSEQKSKDFSKFPQTIVRSGLLAKLSNPAIRVYLVLLTYANYHTGLSFPLVKTITGLTGINKNLVYRALKELVASGLIEKSRGSKRYCHRNFYRVINMPQIFLDALPEKKRKPRKIQKGQRGRFLSCKTVIEQAP